MVLEEEQEQDQPKLTHITIPAAYSSGITLFALRETELGKELLDAPELTLLWQDCHTGTPKHLEFLFIEMMWPIEHA